jgi:TFIIF-interacting CTD phosphatase-like protein
VGRGDLRGYIALRPYALSFLKKVAQHFEVIVFTRLEEPLARAIAEVIDEEGRHIAHLLARGDCLALGGFLCKDLRVLDRSPRDTVVVDCRPEGYMASCENGVPLLPFGGGEERELVGLERFLLRELAGCGDVREVNRRWFKLAHYWQYDSEAELVQELYCDYY